MAELEAKLAKAASSPRSRHKITRSITEVSSPVKLHKHHHHFHYHHRADRDRDDGDNSAPLSVVSTRQPRTSLDRPSSLAVTPNLSPDPSRRASAFVAGEDVNGNRPEEGVIQQRKRAAAQIASLKSSLVNLNQFSISTGERLDGLYRSIQEKLGMLQSTLTALWELAGMSQNVQQTFSREARELVSEVDEQLETFGRFEEQQRVIKQLQDRIQRGRSRITLLSQRIDGVQDRIERWERADREWQERTRKKLKVIWIITSVLILIIILLVLTAQYAGPAIEEATTKFANESLSILRNHTRLLQKPGWGSQNFETSVPVRHPNFTASARKLRNELDLRVFDEL